MDKDLGLDSNKYSIALRVFFVSYVVIEVPSNMILTRNRPSRHLATIMFLWGGVTVGMAFTPNYGAFVAFRFLMGVLESGYAPGILMILPSWYRKEEQSRRFAVYISAAILSGAFGGLLAGSITSGLHDAHGIKGWRWLFIVEGVGTMITAVIAVFILSDFPSNTSKRKLSAAERSLAIRRLQVDVRSHTTEEQPHLTHLQALKLSSGLPLYLTFIRHWSKASDMSKKKHRYVADKNSKWRGVILGAMMSVAMLCSIIICAVYNVKARYALLAIMASGLWASNGLALSYASVTFSSMPNEAKAVSLSIEDAPKYLTGFGVISGLCLTGVLAYMALHLLLGRVTKRSARN
ncbi:hypothetical protein MY4038_007353 [Beauveria bassiana]